MYIMNNYHTHTYHCRHAIGTEKEMVEAAIKAGFSEIGISDHVPLPHFRKHLIKAMPSIFNSKTGIWSWAKACLTNGPGIRMPYKEKNDYLNALNQLKQEYQTQIKIYKGFECEYFKEYLPYYQRLLENKEVDYLIFGHHFNKYSTSAMYYGCANLNKNDVKSYVDGAIEAMQTGLFKYFAHPDLFFTGYHYWDSFVENEVERMLKVAKQCDIILEINGGGFTRKLVTINNEKMYPYPNRYFWQKVKELDCKVIIGLDAHSPMELDCEMYHRLESFAKELSLKPLEKLTFDK